VIARLFFALWPGPDTRERLGRWAAEIHRACGGRRIRDEQLHLTLVFLGAVPVDRIHEVCAAARMQRPPTFTLRFVKGGYWPRKRLVWTAPEETPVPLEALASGLAAELTRTGFRVDGRAYFPHVTLVRDARCRDLSVVPARFEWPVNDFALVRSTQTPAGARYDLIERWPLEPS
jgi:2'-5' RNA ligase